MAIPGVSGADAGGRNSAGAFTAALPTGVSWLAIATCRRSSGGGALITPPAGWTLVQSNSGDVDNAAAVYHSGEATPGTSWTAPSNTRSASVLVIGFDQATTVDVSAAFSTNLTSPSATATEAVRVCRVMTNNAWNHESPTASYPAGTSDGAQVFTQNASGDASEGGSLAAFAGSAQEAAGATGTAAWSFSSGSSFAPRSSTVALVGAGAGDDHEGDGDTATLTLTPGTGAGTPAVTGTGSGASATLTPAAGAGSPAAAGVGQAVTLAPAAQAGAGAAAIAGAGDGATLTLQPGVGEGEGTGTEVEPVDVTVLVGPTRLRQLATVAATRDRSPVAVAATRSGWAVGDTRDRAAAEVAGTRDRQLATVGETRSSWDVGETRDGWAVGDTRSDREG